MISFNTVRMTDSLIDEPEFLDAAIIAVVSSMRRQMDYNHAKYIRDWGDLEQEALRQAHALLKEKGPIATFGKPTSWWVKWLGGKPNYTRIDIEFSKGNIKVKITPIAI